ncbi:WecB/TagA/CpsF family glycosyltransferase [Pseudomonas matsuisoli]|uniref:UDP-N-acetyl-D-mannosaminuronic acid transferase n=1 Tax=Pseudomonas matsuisoli TaxID=1515666 RepID=A0A917UR47_9PSED|nr:WecB/TagA/CpsF family glycosyltransferase [Pseudomonas matsuisoli]GGJ78158.1 UDP-N-acetyl-D-mannosaminuronic acid transferase [Pseudomonas matsuisoli]
MSKDDLIPLFDELCGLGTPTILGFLNQHGYNIAQTSASMRHHFTQMRYVLRDGIGVKIACKASGKDPKANLNGTDLIPELIAYLVDHSARDCQLFAMGTREPWVTEGSKSLFAGRPFHAIEGHQENEVYLDFFKAHYQPGTLAVIVLALGMPRQEELASFLKQTLDVPCLLICGGAMLDFASGRFPRAPLLMRRMGLEWLFRLLLEPRRLFGRYVVGIPLFLYYIARNGVRLNRPRSGQQTAHHAPLPFPETSSESASVNTALDCTLASTSDATSDCNAKTANHG